MELKRQLFRQNLLRSRAFTQITLDDDCIVKDNKPDLLNIIHTRGSVIFEDVKVSSQTVWVTGQLRFVVLYRSEDNRLESFTDSINFGEKIFMDEVEERDTVNLSGDLEDLNISAINSRKLAVRALLGIHAVCEVPVEEEIVSGVENDPDIQQKSRTMQLLALTSAKKDILRVHSDIALPQSSPNIGHLLYDYVEVRNRQVICTGEQMQIQGEAHVNVLYSSPEGKMEWYETMVPFSESIEGGMTGTQPICWVHCQTKEYEVEPAEDYDGEMRALSLNLSMDVEMKLWEERNVELLADVYSLETNLVPQKEMVCAKKLLIKNEAKLRISEQMKLAEEQERILQLCSFEGHAEMDHVEPVENGLQVEGILTVDILYATTDDSFPIAHTQEQIPFTQIVDVPGMKGHTEDISYEIEPAIDQLAVNLLDNERFEVKAVISLQTIVQQEEQERILQLCSFEGHAEMDHVEPVENGLQVEGILTVDILYATTDDSFPIAHTQEQIPFTQIVDVPGMKGHTEDISYEIEPAIDQLAVNLLDNERFEVKAVISLQTIVQQEVCMEKIVDIHKEPLDAVELMKQPGIVGYIVKKEEQLWDIARHFHTTEAEIMETNGLKSADVQQGDKLLIVKKVSEC